MPFDARVDAWALLALKAAAVPHARRAAAQLRRSGRRTLCDARAACDAAAACRGRAHAGAAASRSTRCDARLAADPRHELIAWDDADYPRGLLDLPDAPPALFFVGRRDCSRERPIAIVGSRNATPQGIDNARAFARALSAAGLTIVSGLALGIDAAAHEARSTAPARRSP